MSDTPKQFDEVIHTCRELFLKKNVDYGSSWRVLRPISVVDQIYIKAYRIRNIQERGTQKVEDDIQTEFIGIINYAIIGLIQLQLSEEYDEDMEAAALKALYDDYAAKAKALMQDKNHDYDEAWRKMSQEGLTDLILMKLHRMRSIISNKGNTMVSEGLDANFYDILNYAIFAMILLQEKTST